MSELVLALAITMIVVISTKKKLIKAMLVAMRMTFQYNLYFGTRSILSQS